MGSYRTHQEVFFGGHYLVTSHKIYINPEGLIKHTAYRQLKRRAYVMGVHIHIRKPSVEVYTDRCVSVFEVTHITLNKHTYYTLFANWKGFCTTINHFEKHIRVDLCTFLLACSGAVSAVDTTTYVLLRLLPTYTQKLLLPHWGRRNEKKSIQMTIGPIHTHHGWPTGIYDISNRSCNFFTIFNAT